MKAGEPHAESMSDMKAWAPGPPKEARLGGHLPSAVLQGQHKITSGLWSAGRVDWGSRERGKLSRAVVTRTGTTWPVWAKAQPFRPRLPGEGRRSQSRFRQPGCQDEGFCSLAVQQKKKKVPPSPFSLSLTSQWSSKCKICHLLIC